MPATMTSDGSNGASSEVAYLPSTGDATKERKKQSKGCQSSLGVLWLTASLLAISSLVCAFRFTISPRLSARTPEALHHTPTEEWTVGQRSVGGVTRPQCSGSSCGRAAGAGGVAALDATPDTSMENEFDPTTGLSLPKFWVPPTDVDLEDYSPLVDGRPTILLLFTSYRDFQCPESVRNAFMRAAHPERLMVAIVDQIVTGDVPCYQPPSCSGGSETADRVMCAHYERVRSYRMNAKHATGPTFARHIGHRMYRGEAFVMQVDSHVEFVAGWDEDILQQWRQTRNEYAVLTTYMTDLTNAIDPSTNRSRMRTRPIMCNSNFESGQGGRYLRHGSQPEEVAAAALLSPCPRH